MRARQDLPSLAFLSGLGHELRTPLNAILGFAEVLLDESFGELSPRQQVYLRHILGAGHELFSLIDRVLDLARLHAGALELEPQPYALGVLVTEAVAALQPLSAELGLRMQARVELPGAWLVDPGLFGRIAEAALRLSMDRALALGSASVEVSCKRVDWTEGEAPRPAAAGAWILLEASTGPASPAPLHASGRFRAAGPEAAALAKGHRIPMSFAQSLIEMLGGYLWVEESESFRATVLLPARPADSAPATRPAAATDEAPAREAAPAGLPAAAPGIDARMPAAPGEVLLLSEDPWAVMLIEESFADSGVRLLAPEAAAPLPDGARVLCDLRLPDGGCWRRLEELAELGVSGSRIILFACDESLGGFVLESPAHYAVPAAAARLVELLLRECESGCVALAVGLPADLRAELQRRLGGSGSALLVAATAEEARRLAEQTRPELVLLDLTEPQVSGFLLTHELAGRRGAPLVLSVSSALRGRPHASALDELVLARLEDARHPGSAIGHLLRDRLEAGPAASIAARPLVLLVEDNELNLELFEALLEPHFRTISARSGLEVERLVAQQRPDLVLMDLELPGVDGLTLARRLKAAEATRGIPVVALTAHTEHEARALTAAGFEGCITKPIDMRGFVTLVRSYLH
jgi:CheY-like chemotaxis protein